MTMYKAFEEIKTAITEGSTSCEALVKGYLARIEEKKHLNVWNEVYTEEALQKAKEVDAKIAKGNAGRLAGMVVGLKDVIAYKDHGLQASSNMLDGYVSPFSATATDRLLAEDAIIIGRQSCDEFAMGSSNENSAFGVVKNNIDETRVPGGSSGASAVAVSDDHCLVSLGSDTGGSVRQPAAFTGTVGLKPTYSRISRWGLIAYASSFDTIGVIANNVPDASLVLEIIAGQDENDATVSQKEVPAYSKTVEEKPKEKLKIAYFKETVESEHLNKEISKKTFDKIEALRAEGHEVEGIEFPLLDYLLPTYYILTTAEASTNLERFDGVRYGHRTKENVDLEGLYKKSRSEGFGTEVKRRIMLGTFVLSASYYDAYFSKAQKVRRMIKESTEKILSEYDFILMPTTSTPSFEIGKYGENNLLELYLGDLYTVHASLAGLPAISIPNGEDKDGLTIGLQIMANRFEEEKMLSFSQYVSQL
ncbi:Asp-tRNA(Asn)/Glu-tRNA(Gln) amidotransferase subunit GatA [Flammeovirga kamogawensis]|uniref:Glutamyl-tRNA(Gln) amidotransferase subunit A n=1 Tax=Flammeovirga kamogawensis TaxID=373891 RepID=A0ABX8GTJ7_9BACT|nr:Asp-tRNA(Asn)/Glu-tRNA(Gln) amidotransferase subunit GatA [Flammeovirga kamogawensis]QWG06567.1 Asp-tRNA(Asn)/Glu-tRNA(Gln) amidotransferase subunit GatA [Flammeovirga kamogawensis]TRX68393.1 Asp-tRNA(Asn)/Glu-tRNA(Gln) amidotransferase subunit GatA [Flammeovirga kamogawensis]